MKNRTKIILGVVATIVAVTGVFIAPIAARMPIAQAERVKNGDLAGVDAGGSFAWIIPATAGVILIDAGWSTDAAEIRAEIGDQPVLAIFITHAHFDHTGGLAAFPDAPVYIAAEETALLRGDVKPQGWMARMSTTMMAPTAPNPQNVIETADGQEIDINGATIRVIHTPGHTTGSAMYIWNDTLFSGDSIVGRGDRVNEIPKPTADDYDQIRTSVEKVLAYEFENLADGHIGFHSEIRTQVEAYVNNH